MSISPRDKSFDCWVNKILYGVEEETSEIGQLQREMYHLVIGSKNEEQAKAFENMIQKVNNAVCDIGESFITMEPCRCNRFDKNKMMVRVFNLKKICMESKVHKELSDLMKKSIEKLAMLDPDVQKLIQSQSDEEMSGLIESFYRENQDLLHNPK